MDSIRIHQIAETLPLRGASGRRLAATAEYRLWHVPCFDARGQRPRNTERRRGDSPESSSAIAVSASQLSCLQGDC